MQADKLECPERYNGYLNLVPEGDFLEIINESMKETLLLFKSVSEENSLFRYEEEKWSVKQMLGHLIDIERIFSYWILRISRGDRKDTPDYDDNFYIENSVYDSVLLKELIREYRTLKVANILMYESFGENQLNMKGTINKDSFSVRALINILIGHELHHIKVFKERYLPKLEENL